MFRLNVTIGLILIASLCCRAKLTHHQKSIIHSHLAECASDLDIKEYIKLELEGFTGHQTTPDANFLKLLHCIILRMELIDCDGVYSMDKFAAFISDGHNNIEHLSAVQKSCVERIKGSAEEKAFQFYRCMFSQDNFQI